MKSADDKGNRWACGFVALFALLAGCASNASKVMNRPISHRTLLVSDADIVRTHELTQSDPQLQRVFETLRTSADRLLNDPPLEYKLIGPRLLSVSKEAQRRIWLLSGMYRYTGDKKYLDRAVIELRAVCNFKDWHPPHFLDVAEMSAAVAVGYDWLYDDLSNDDRALIRKAIVTHAMLPAIDAFKQKIWWTTTDINWAQVCSGGLIMGALAIRNEEPAISRKIFDLTATCIARPMHTYSPDGGYKEGAGYWHYGTRFNVLYLAALQSTVGYESPLIKSDGFDKTGFFRIHTIGPSNKLFNYADCNEPVDSASEMFWLARQFSQPIFAQHERTFALAKPDILHLFWWRGDQADLSAVPTQAIFPKAGAICLRSGWDADAMYIGMKTGVSNFGHAHLDLGSFVLDWNGDRWASDLGSDDYNLPGYFGKERFNYYRLRTEGHNTVMIDHEEQSQQSTSNILSANEISFGTKSGNVNRIASILSPSEATVEDHVTCPGEHTITWTLHTRANATLSADGRTATLKLKDKELRVELSGDGRLNITPLDLAAPQKPTKGVTKLTIELRATDHATISVRFVGSGRGNPTP